MMSRFGAIAETYTELVEGRLGDVERDDRPVTVVDELPDHRRRAATATATGPEGTVTRRIISRQVIAVG